MSRSPSKFRNSRKTVGSARVTKPDQSSANQRTQVTVNHVFGCRGLIGRNILKASRRFHKNLTFGYTRTTGSEVDLLDEIINLDLAREFDKATLTSLVPREAPSQNLVLSAWSGHPRCDSVANAEANRQIIRNYRNIINWTKPNYVVFVSSSGALCQSGQIFTEETEPSPTSQYAIQKLFAEKELSQCCHDLGIPIGILRISSASGFTGAAKGLGVLNEWSNKAVAGTPISLLRPLNSTVNLIGERSLEEAFSFCLENLPDGVFNIASSNTVSLEEIVRCLGTLLGFEAKVAEADLSNSAAFETLIDNSKFKLASGLNLDFDLKEEARLILAEALFSQRIKS